MSVAIVDYGMGNLRSVVKALEYLEVQGIQVTDDAEAILAAERVVFPGQGAVRDCMSALHRHELVDVLSQALASRPFLGICMGMQALMTASDENDGVPALNHIAGRVRHFRNLLAPRAGLKVPHMGWNQLEQRRAHPVFSGILAGERFYFVHSYYVAPERDELILGDSTYGERFAAAIGVGNVVAVQFHPEKSQRAGLRLLENFLAWDGSKCC